MGTFKYSVEENGQRTPISEEEAMEYIADASSRFNEIRYTDISEEDIEERFAEFKENGNRRRRRNRGEEAAAQPEKETVWPWGQGEEQEAQGTQETPANETEITLSDSELENLQAMVRVFTMDSYFFSEDMFGNSYPVDNLEEDMKLIDMMYYIGYGADSYWRYLPAMELDPEIYGKKYFEIDDMKSYLKNVFGIEDADLSAYYEGDRVVLSLLADPLQGGRNVVDHAVQTAEGNYKISGICYFYGGTGATEETGFHYTTIVSKNDASPFGFQMISLEFGEEVQWDDGRQAFEDGSLGDILLDPEENSAYYPQEVEYQHRVFALLDIDQDGEEEILLGSASDLDHYWGPSWVTIFNILKYDRNTGEVWDFDGDIIYRPLDANSWHYYDTGILMTRVEAGQGHTNFWNLRTGEFINAASTTSG